VNPKSLRRAAISPIRYTLRQRKSRLSLDVRITENFCREQTLTAIALRQHQKPIRYARCQRKGPSSVSEATDINSNYKSDSKKNQASYVITIKYLYYFSS